MEITFSFLFQQLCPFKGKPAQGRMNAGCTEHFPSAVHQGPHPPPRQSTAGSRVGDYRSWDSQPAVEQSPKSLARQGRHAEVVG